MPPIVPAPGDLRAILINNNAEATNVGIVDLILSAENATEMLLGTDQDFTGSSWEPFVTAKQFAVADEQIGPGFGDGDKQIFVKFRDGALDESDVFSATIALDATPPIVGPVPILINDGEIQTDNQVVTIALDATNATSIQIINEDQLDQQDIATIDFAQQIAHTLSDGNGQKTVFVNFLDQIGNQTGFFSASIMLTGQQIGSATITQPEGDQSTTDKFITIRGTGDPGSTVIIDIEALQTIDGAVNNLDNPEWGEKHIPLQRLTSVGYADGIEDPAGPSRPSPRAISNIVCAQDQSIPSPTGVSDLFWQWGQMLDHDLALSEAAMPLEPFDISVPTGDPFFDPMSEGGKTISLNRSIYQYIDGRREQINEISSYIDAGFVYGSDETRANALRALDGTGKMKTSDGNLLPFNEDGLPNAGGTGSDLFLAGDVRANEQIGLIAIHTLWVREHNYWCDQIIAESPTLSGDDIYHKARRIVISEIQSITYNEFLPLLLGSQAIQPYAGYNRSVNASLSNEFSTAAYRLGHSLLSDSLLRLDSNGNPTADSPISLADAFFVPQEVVDNGIDTLLRGMALQVAQRIDPYTVDSVRNFLFGPPGAGGFDLASLNIQRGRDHGLPSYIQARIDLGLDPIETFADISSDLEIQTRLATAYSDVDQIDLWIGGLSEDHLEGAMVGPTISAILTDQFTRTRDGDRFWYQNMLSPEMIEMIESQTLATVIRRNTDIGTEINDQAFLVGGA